MSSFKEILDEIKTALSELLDLDSDLDSSYENMPGQKTLLVWPNTITLDTNQIIYTWFAGITITEEDLEELTESMGLIDTLTDAMIKNQLCITDSRLVLNGIDISTPSSSAQSADLSELGSRQVILVLDLETRVYVQD